MPSFDRRLSVGVCAKPPKVSGTPVTVDVQGTPGAYTVGNQYTFMNANSIAVNGGMPVFTDDIADIRVRGLLSPAFYNLQILRDVPFANIGQTPNQVNFGQYFDIVKTTPNADLQFIRDELDLLPTEDAVRGAMNQLIGDIYGTLAVAELQHTSHVFSQLRQQTGGTMNAVGLNDQYVSNMWGAQTSGDDEVDFEYEFARAQCMEAQSLYQNEGWISGYALNGNLFSDNNASAADLRLGGTQFGVAEYLDPTTKVGFFGAYGNSLLRTAPTNQSMNIENVLLGLFLQKDTETDYFLAAVAGGNDHFNSTRQIMFGGVNRVASADFNGQQVAAYLEKGLKLDTETLRIRPMFAMQYVNIHQNGFAETGAGAANLVVAGEQFNSLRSILGTSLAAVPCETPTGWMITPDAHIAWQHEYLDTNNLVSSGLIAAAPPTFGTQGLDLGRDFLFTGAGLSLSPNQALNFRVGYDAQLNNNETLHVGSGTVTLLW